MVCPNLTVAIIARDEEALIAAALASARPLTAELLLVLDPRTTDRTALIAAEHGARVDQHIFRSFGAQRNHALTICRTPWILFLDADERISPELQTELAMALQQSGSYHGYWVPRRNRYWHHWLRGGGWYPDYQLRLLQRDHAHYSPDRLVHEFAELDGAVGYLHEHLLHWNINSWAELRSKQRHYALAEAQTLYRAGVRASRRNLLLQPLREVKRRFWTWHGYRDRGLGLFLALVMGYYEWVKYVHLAGLAEAMSERHG
ncbi:MAG: glycosyltransferase family 2 protein [Herpetosiphonaceae bacterium]|nr:glycosyltransferase family 2 protein [Herpetosiphonaceae bacterium]